MSSVTTAHHRVAIAGHVTDGVTGRVMSGVMLSIAEMPESFRRRLHGLALEWGAKWESMTARADKTLTRADGLFYFLDLPEGDYTLQAACPQLGQRYGTDEASVRVGDASVTNCQPGWTVLRLPPSGIQGSVMSKKSAVVHASVSVRGSAESVFTDTNGRYALTGIEAGQRTVVIKAQGFRSVVQEVQIAGPGQMVTTDISLLREGA